MALFSTGYDGTIDETQWAKLQGAAASVYGVSTPTSWAVTPVAGADRTISIAPGIGWGHHVLDESDSNYTLQGGAVSSGSRWDTVVLRRNWAPIGGGPSAFRLNPGTGTRAIASRQTNPGTLDDQPIALVQFTAGQTQPTAIVDLRCWAANGGVEAADKLALDYLGRPGAAVKIGSALWRYEKRANNVWTWRDYQDVRITTEGHTHDAPILKTGTVTVRSDANGATAFQFATPFPRRILGATITQAMAANLGLIHVMYDEALSHTGRVAFFVYDNAGNRLRNTAGIRMSFIACGD